MQKAFCGLGGAIKKLFKKLFEKAADKGTLNDRNAANIEYFKV